VRLEARTIDSLLGMHIHALTPRKNRQNPLDVDMLVVDEASMLSLPMVYRLLQALPEKARLVLLGDRDQLASVEAGSVLADICQGLAGKGAVHVITQSRRFSGEPEIGAMANWLNNPVLPKPEFAGNSVKVHITTGGNPWQPEWLDAVQQFHSGVESAIHSGKPCVDILAKQQQFQLLCAFREGPFGVSGINNILEKALGHPANGWYAGKPVIVLQNDHSRRLYNGDVGIVLPQEDGSLKACFPDGADIRAISRMQMPPYETCYAITVHKSQGSEYNQVVVVLPASAKDAAGNPVLTRELAYTAVTRAKQKVDIHCGEGVLEGMAGRTTVRMSSMFIAQPL
jgi:exodeoxyribonuclease V alpha subunit